MTQTKQNDGHRVDKKALEKSKQQKAKDQESGKIVRK